MSDTPFTIRQWETFERTIRLRRRDGTPFELTDEYELIGQIRRQYADAVAAATFEVTPGEAAGDVKICLSPEATGKLVVARAPKPSYHYDLVLRRKSDNWRKRVIAGPIVVEPGVTR